MSLQVQYQQFGIEILETAKKIATDLGASSPGEEGSQVLMSTRLRSPLLPANLLTLTACHLCLHFSELTLFTAMYVSIMLAA